jgi:hypothetical protein
MLFITMHTTVQPGGNFYKAVLYTRTKSISSSCFPKPLTLKSSIVISIREMSVRFRPSQSNAKSPPTLRVPFPLSRTHQACFRDPSASPPRSSSSPEP